MNSRHDRLAPCVVLAMAALGAPLIAQTVPGIGTDGAIACSPSTVGPSGTAAAGSDDRAAVTVVDGGSAVRRSGAAP